MTIRFKTDKLTVCIKNYQKIRDMMTHLVFNIKC